jgi:phage terminase large subunit-like protein
MLPSFSLTPRQQEANTLLGSSALHTMLVGGARSGKTTLIIRAIITRALAHKSRHAVLRYRFNHLKGSVLYDTLPKVMSNCFPGVAEKCHLDKSDWFYTLPNGSEIWFGGLDDKERTEKILGSEYATLFLNECSQIPWSSRNVAITRLAQRTPLRLRAWYDANPPNDAHWTKKVFIDKVDPDTKTKLADPENYASMTINPAHNLDNLPTDYIKTLEGLPTRLRNRFLYGLFTSTTDGALWTSEMLDSGRVMDGDVPDLQRIVIAVDPSGCSGPEDKRSDEIGIIVGGLGTDGRAYVLEDLSGRFGPQKWGAIVLSAFDRWRADVIVAEMNYGGAMVEEVLRAAASEAKHPRLPFKMVHASRGKVVRAEPIAALYGTEEKIGKIAHVGIFPLLEDQLCGFSTGGYTGERSPDRADALVWCMAELFPALSRPEKKPYSMPVEKNEVGQHGWLG